MALNRNITFGMTHCTGNTYLTDEASGRDVDTHWKDSISQNLTVLKDRLDRNTTTRNSDHSQQRSFATAIIRSGR
jgi:hypothetical protein